MANIYSLQIWKLQQMISWNVQIVSIAVFAYRVMG